MGPVDLSQTPLLPRGARGVGVHREGLQHEEGRQQCSLLQLWTVATLPLPNFQTCRELHRPDDMAVRVWIRAQDQYVAKPSVQGQIQSMILDLAHRVRHSTKGHLWDPSRCLGLASCTDSINQIQPMEQLFSPGLQATRAPLFQSTRVKG